MTCLFFFHCQAVDKGPPHDQNVTAQVVITVVDVNDNSPVCEQPQSTIPLFLLAKVNEEVYTVSCSDRDRSPEFNQLRYAIKSQSVDGSKFLKYETRIFEPVREITTIYVPTRSDTNRAVQS